MLTPRLPLRWPSADNIFARVDVAACAGNCDRRGRLVLPVLDWLLKIVTPLVGFLAVLTGVRGDTWDAAKARPTRIGYLALAGGALAVVLNIGSVAVTARLESDKGKRAATEAADSAAKRQRHSDSVAHENALRTSSRICSVSALRAEVWVDLDSTSYSAWGTRYERWYRGMSQQEIRRVQLGLGPTVSPLFVLPGERGRTTPTALASAWDLSIKLYARADTVHCGKRTDGASSHWRSQDGLVSAVLPLGNAHWQPFLGRTVITVVDGSNLSFRRGGEHPIRTSVDLEGACAFVWVHPSLSEYQTATPSEHETLEAQRQHVNLHSAWMTVDGEEYYFEREKTRQHSMTMPRWIVSRNH
jgi:hypothetical protein